jgi:uncharacterized membrane protein
MKLADLNPGLVGEHDMRRIFMAGLFACFLIGLVFFFFRFIIVDILAPLFQPLVVRITGSDTLVIPLSIVFTLIIILTVGAIVTRIKFQDLYNKYFHRVPPDLQKGRGALISLGTETYFLAIIIKEITFNQSDGEAQQYFVLYGPSVPLPWSGLPILFVPKDRVHPLKLSYGEIYSMLGSFGANTPNVLTELKMRGLVEEEKEAKE